MNNFYFAGRTIGFNNKRNDNSTLNTLLQTCTRVLDVLIEPTHKFRITSRKTGVFKYYIIYKVSVLVFFNDTLYYL